MTKSLSTRSNAKAISFGLWLWASFSVVAQATTPAAPTFADRYDYAGCSTGPYQITSGDVNRDGIPDLVCTGEFGGMLTLFGNGDGTFRQGPSSNPGFYAPGTPVLVDLNGDGKLDLVLIAGFTFLSGPLGLDVCFGNGDGTFQTGTFYAAGKNIYVGNIVGGDFNRDGLLDFAFQTESGVWLFTGKGGGVFNSGVLTPVTLTDSVFQLGAVDLNGDGKLDLIVGPDDGFGVLLGNGDGTFQPQINTRVPSEGDAFAIGDFNGDGKPDVFAVTVLGSNGYLYLGNGDGTFKLSRQVNVGSTEPVTVSAADINGDGYLDIVTAAGYVMFGNGQGNFSPPTFYITETGDSNWYVLPADLRRKGLVDLVFTNFYPGISVLLNEGHGKFFEGLAVPIAGGGAYCAVAADFNGDGIPDFAVKVDQGLSILLGTGKASAPYTQGELITYSTSSCPVEGDLNREGIPDLFVTTGTNQAVAYLGNGDGTFTQVAKTTALFSNGIPVLGDFNGDGKLDFALSSNLLAYGNGDGTFQTPAPYIPKVMGNDIVGIASGRLRGGELSDIILTDFFGDLVYVLRSTGHGFSETTFGVGLQCAGPINPVLADVNQDGYEDLLLGCGDANVPIYVNNREGVFTYATSENYVQAADAAYPLVADLNGDGIPDLVIQGNSDLGIFPGEGSLMFAAPLYIGFGTLPGHVIAVNAHGQSPQSGKPDLITPDGTGVINVFFNTTK